MGGGGITPQNSRVQHPASLLHHLHIKRSYKQLLCYKYVYTLGRMSYQTYLAYLVHFACKVDRNVGKYYL